MPPPTLPAELIAHILDYAVTGSTYQCRNGQRDRQTMAQACLVSRTFLPLARARLYHTLVITLGSVGGPLVGEPTEVSHRLAAAMEDATLASMARTLVVEASDHSGDGGASMVAQILRACSKLTSLELRDVMDDPDTDDGAALTKAVVDGGKHLRTLRMFGTISSVDSPLFPLLQLSNLDALDIGFLDIDNPTTTPLGITHPLRYLAFNDNFGLDIAHLIKDSHTYTSLRYLALNSWGVQHDLAPLLGLDVLRYEVEVQSPEGVDAVVQTLKSVSNLSVTTLYLSLAVDERLDPDEATACAQAFNEARVFLHLPSSLTSLYVRDAPPHPFNYLLQFLKAPHACPLLHYFQPPPSFYGTFLKTLDLTNEYGRHAFEISRRPYATAEDKEEAKRLRRLAGELDEPWEHFKQECRRRGLRVSNARYDAIWY